MQHIHLQSILSEINSAVSFHPDSRFIVYGDALNFAKLQQFFGLAEQEFKLIDAWNVQHYTVVMLSGMITPSLQKIAHQLQLDIAPVRQTPNLNHPGLLVMDMDSTAIEIECIDEIAKLAGSGDEVAKITEQAMRGELDFEQSLRYRVNTLTGADESILQRVREKLPLMPGLSNMIVELQQNGWKTAIASGGFSYFADYLKSALNLDEVVSNQLEIVDGCLTGKVLGKVVDAQYKAEILQSLVKRFSIEPSQSIAIGDGANDLLMLNASGLGIAYHAKPKVQQQASIVVNFADLTAILCILSANTKY